MLHSVVRVNSVVLSLGVILWLTVPRVCVQSPQEHLKQAVPFSLLGQIKCMK